jgi:hypothetical protein
VNDLIFSLRPSFCKATDKGLILYPGKGLCPNCEIEIKIKI